MDICLFIKEISVTKSDLLRYYLMMMEEYKNIVKEYKQGLFRYAKRLLGNREDAEDAVQEAFIKIWQKWDSIDRARIQYYAYFITRNLCIDKLRSKYYKNKTIDIDKLDYELTSTAKSPEYITDMNYAYGLINQTLDSFPENWKTIFQLCDVEGLSYDEVNDIIGVSAPTLRVNLSRIRKRLKDVMEKKYGYVYENQ